MPSNRSITAMKIALMGVVAAVAIGAPAAGTGEPPESPSRPPSPQPGRPVEVTVEQAEKERARLEKLVFAAFDRRDWPAAEAALRELIPYDHQNFVPWYNLACALSLQNKPDEAVQMLDQSIARGFADRRQLETDPHLAAVRQTERFKALLASWDRMLDRRAVTNLEAAKQVFASEATASQYTTETDEALRLKYLSAFDPALFAEARKQLELATDWWVQHVAPVEDGAVASAAAGATPWVTVVLPARVDYARWALRRFGEGWERIGGQYSHDNKLLVAMDLGSTLRHEYWHVLHWRDQDRRGQRHPIWIMEGLCSLPEDLEPTATGDFKPAPSWRTNMAKRLARAGGLMPWEVMFSLDPQRFTRSRPLAQYAQGRAIFLWLFERGKLREWYSAYTRTYGEDPSGKAAFVEVFGGKPLKEIERDFRMWVRDLPEVQNSIGNGPANLPFDVGPGAGDGPTVDAPPDLSLSTSRTKALGGRDGLKHGDVLTAIDGKPLRDLNDLARLLGDYEAGATVELSFRRKDRHGKVKVVLVGPE